MAAERNPVSKGGLTDLPCASAHAVEVSEISRAVGGSLARFKLDEREQLPCNSYSR